MEVSFVFVLSFEIYTLKLMVARYLRSWDHVDFRLLTVRDGFF